MDKTTDPRTTVRTIYIDQKLTAAEKLAQLEQMRSQVDTSVKREIDTFKTALVEDSKESQ